MTYSAEQRTAEEAARAAAAFIAAHAGRLAPSDLRAKAQHDYVSYVDEGAQAIILEHLARAFPSDAVLAEEGAAGVVASAGRQWIVDPLDGTTNFAHGVPPYAVSIGLRVDGRAAVGVVLDVSTGTLFSAADGAGLTVDPGEPGQAPRAARVSETATLDDALVATGVPFRDYRWAEGYLATFERVMRRTRGIRRHGAASVDLAWTAAGRFDAFFEAGLAPWDVAAGVALVEAAGGRVTGLWAGADPVAGGGVIATNGHLHGAMETLCEPLADAYRLMGHGA